MYSSLAMAKLESKNIAKSAAPAAQTAKRQPQQEFSADEEESLSAIENSNCHISIRTTRMSGIRELQQFYTVAQSESDCAIKAKPHRYNLYPDEIKSISVKHKFLGRDK